MKDFPGLYRGIKTHTYDIINSILNKCQENVTPGWVVLLFNNKPSTDIVHGQVQSYPQNGGLFS